MTEAATLDDERGIPSVSKERNGNWTGLLMAAFGVLSVVVVWFNWPESEAVTEDTLPAQVEEAFDRERITKLEIPDLPYDTPQSLPMISAAVAEPENTFDESPEIDPAMEDLRERRKRSPLVIYDNLKDSQLPAQVAQPTPPAAPDYLQALQAMQGAGQEPAPDPNALSTNLQSEGVTTVTARILRDRPYLIAQGQMIGAVIETAISSDLPGMVRAIVSEPVYSENGENRLIDKGSRIIGEYRAGLVQGQGRIFVIWNRIITPSGVDVMIASPGTDPLGRAGHSGWIDDHFAKRFGASVLLSLVGAAVASTTDSSDNDIADDIGDNFNDSAAIALENSIGIKPTLHKNQGDRIKIFVANDLNFRAVTKLLQ